MSGLVAEGLVVGQGGFRAGPFSFAAAPGALLAMIGPNGGGKSTLLRTLAGLQPALGGVVQRPGSGPAALLPPPGTLNAPFSAAHMVTLGRAGRAGLAPRLGRADRDAAQGALAALGIDALGLCPFDRLSSGQQQLVLLARLIVQESLLCLLDEPAAMLDPAQTMKVAAAIQDLTLSGRIVVVATHDIGFAAGCDQVLAVGGENCIGEPAAMLTAARLSALYGAELGTCSCCGQFSAAAIRA